MTMRIWMMLLTAIVAMSFAGGAAADNKRWSVAASPTAFATANDVMVTITITNQTPNGNANINSLQIALPAGYTVNTSHVGGAPVTTTWPGQLDWTTQSGVITFSNMAPLANTSFAIVAFLNVDTGTAGCTANAWPGFPSTRAFTGSTFTGSDFTLTSKPTTSVNAAKALAFQNVTPNVPVGTDITGSVTATSCGKVPSPAVSVKVDLLNGANTSVATATGSNGASIDFPTTTIAPGSYTLKASVPADAGYTPITTPVTVCGNALAFTGQPSNIKLGDTDSATIQAKTCGTVAQGVSVTAQLQDSSNKPIGDSQTASTDTSGNVTFQFTPAALGAYTILATATNYSDATSNVFKVFAGILACGDPLATSFINPDDIGPDQPGYAAGTRNAYNKDGVSEQCKQVLYTFTNTILQNETVNLTWDTSLQPNAAFEYTVNWQAQPVESGDKVSGWPMELRPVVAWLNEDGSESTGLSANPAFRPALACLGNSLPMPYGTLASPILDTTSTSITITGIASNPTVLNPVPPHAPYAKPVPGDPAIPAYPFPIVIADMVNGVSSTATERMLVTGDTMRGSTNGIWTITFTVQRGDGGTTPALHGTNPADPASPANRVMSTPLPLIPTDDPTNYPSGGVYKPGTQAHMCIAAHGFTAFNFAATPQGGVQVLYQTHVFDIGDGWVGLR